MARKPIGIVVDETEEKPQRMRQPIGVVIEPEQPAQPTQPAPVQAGMIPSTQRQPLVSEQPAQPAQPAAQPQYRAPGAGLSEYGMLPGVEIGQTRYPGQVPQIAVTPERELTTGSGGYLSGVGKRALGLGEIGLQGLTGGAADIAAGLGGIATAAQQTAPGRMAMNVLTMGRAAGLGELQRRQAEAQPELGAQRAQQAVEQMQQALTYEPRGMGAKEAMGALGYAAEKAAPVIVPAMKGFEAAKEKAGEIAGPTGAAIVGTLPAAIAEIGVMKIARGAKKQLVKKLLKESAPEEVIDTATGAVKKEVADAAAEYGLKQIEMLPLSGEEVERQARQIGKTVTAGPFSKKAASDKLADMIKADPEIVKIAREFGVDENLPTGVATRDYSHQRVVQGLSSIAGSKQAERMHNFTMDVAERAKNLIDEMGGTREKSELSDLYRETGKKMLEDMGEQTKRLYNEVNTQIVRRAGQKAVPIQAPNTIEYIQDILEKRGGKMQRLDPLERELLNELSPDAEPTYDWLDQLRQDVGAALEGKKSDPAFADKDRDQLKALYAVLSKDQEKAAGDYGLAETFNEAKALHATRMGIQDKFIKTMGKELTGTISQKARQAIIALGRKDTKQWDDLVKNIPEEMGPEFRKQIIASSVYDAMIGSQAMRGNISPGSFSKFMQSMTDNKGARDRLIREIGTENFNKLNRFGKLVTQLHRAASKQEYTGKIMSVPGAIDEMESIAERIYGKIPSGRQQRAMETIFQGQKTQKSELGDKLLDSPAFRDKVFKKALGQLDDQQTAAIDKVLMGNATFKEWMATLGPNELKTLAAVGPLGYVTGETIKAGEQMAQAEEAQQ